MKSVAAFLFVRSKNSVLFAACCLLLCACDVVKRYPASRPFVYRTVVNVEGNLSTTERKDLTARLQQQLMDSVNPRRTRVLIGLEQGFPIRTFYSILRNPPVYDSANADKSLVYMRALLHTLGYYRDTITYDTSLRIRDDQYRTTLTFNVRPGRQFRIDSLSYTLPDDTLRQITSRTGGSALIYKGAPFSQPLLSSELDRLTDIYRNNGYLRFSREELQVVWDTVGVELLRPNLDPFQQADLFERLRQRRLNPTADVEIRFRPNKDTTHLTRFYVGNVTVYPDLTVDTSLYIRSVHSDSNVQIVTYRNLFKDRIIKENIYLHHGQLYRQSNYLKTLNRFNALGAWRLTSIDQLPRPGTDTVDFVVKLTPAPKYLTTAKIEGSQNVTVGFAAGNILGLNLGILNRNFARAANQSNTNLRLGTELTTQGFTRTQQFSLGHSIFFPRLIPRWKFLGPSLRENVRTSLAFNSNFVVRDTFYNVITVNTSWGYEFVWKRKLLTVRIPNIEYTLLDRKQGLNRLIDSIQSFHYIFNDGLVTSSIINYQIAGGRKDLTSIARFGLEASGLLLRQIQSKFLDSNLYRFVRIDGDFRQTYKFRRSAFAWRAFAGFGFALPTSDADSNNLYLPFFKGYFAGGANSMRAWPLRRLGPGSAIQSFALRQAPDRFGDMQLELNAEYRFFLTELAGVALNSVLWTDIGNIWYLRENKAFPNGEFRLNRLLTDIAIGAGTGLRVDFGLFLVRLDWGYKIKDPSPENPALQNKFFPERHLLRGGQLQLGVTYPF